MATTAGNEAFCARHGRQEAEHVRKAEDDLLDRVQEWRNKRSSLESAVVDQIYNSFTSDQQARAIYDRICETSRVSETLVSGRHVHSKFQFKI